MIDAALADRPGHGHGDVEFLGSYGIPASACVVAYDSIQRLLMVGTRDGRIKLVGTAAVERTLVSKRRSATVSLNVLPNTGCFLRLESFGHLELWSIRLCKCLCTLSADVGDPIVSCCPLLNSPFALLGLGSGSLQCCAFVNAAGEHVGPARPIEGLQWMPFTVPTDDINIPDDSELQHVTSMQRCDGEFRVLLLHEYQTVTAMSLASGEVLAQLSCTSAGISSDITTVCWANTAADQVLTGHGDGSIILWGTASASFRKLDTYSVVSDDHRAPVTSLSMVLGPHMSIVASGGNIVDVPDSVSLIHVTPAARTGGGPGTVQHVSHVPWFGKLQGFALVRPRGSFRTHDAPSAVITLTEGGYLCIQDIDSGRTDPFVGDFQARVIVTSAMALVPQSHLHPSVLSVESLQEHRVVEALSETWDWALHSGRPCCADAGIPAASHGGGDGVAAGGVEVLLTGHDNGAVSLWDVRSLTPQRLSHVAASARPVTTIHLDTVTGLLATGHAGGEVNVHLWSPDGPQTDGPHILTPSAWPSSHHSPERKTHGNACWEHALHISGTKPPLSSSERVVALAMHRQWQPTTVRLAIAFASAGLAVVDLSEGLHCPRWLWDVSLGAEVPGALAFASLPVRGTSHRTRSSHRGSGSGADYTLTLLVATADSCLRAYDAADGKPLGDSWMVPKSKEPLLACVPLSADGSRAQCCDDGGASSWIPCADGWMRLPGHSCSHTPRAGASEGLLSRAPSALASHKSESESDMVSGSSAAFAARESAGRASGTGRSGASASDSAHESRHSRDGSQLLDASMSSREASGLAEERGGEDVGDSGHFDGADDEDPAAATEDGRQRAARALQKAASGKSATKLKGILSGATRVSHRMTDMAAAHAKAVADKAATQAKSVTGAGRRMSFLRGDRAQQRRAASADEGSSRSLPEPIAEGLSPRAKRHSSSELSSPRQPLSHPTSPLSGVISAFSRSAPAQEHGHGAVWILVVTNQCIRVYPASAAVSGSRSTSAKFKVDGEVASGAVISPPGQPPVAVAWSETSGLHIANLPALEVTRHHKLEALTGWHWNWAEDVVASKHQRDRVAVLSDTGLLCMIGPCCELLMLGLSRQRPSPLPAGAFHDDEVAAAAYSAQAAPSMRRRSSSDSGSGGRRSGGSGSRPGASAPKPGIQGLLAGLDKKLKDVLADGGGRSGAGDTAGNAEQWQGSLSDAGAQLERLLRSSGIATAPPLQARVVMTAEASPHAVSPSAPVPQPRASSAVRSTGASSSAGTAAAPLRPGPAPAVRSASEIRRVYGRERTGAAQSVAQGTKDVMKDNVARLHERMERLRGIEDRANDLANDAEDFASMAKKLNQEANRPWWKPF